MLHNLDPLAGLDRAEVQRAIRNAAGPRPSLFVPEASFEVLIRKQIARLNHPAQLCVQAVEEELLHVAHRAAGLSQEAAVKPIELRRYPKLAEGLKAVTCQLIGERLPVCMQLVETLVSMEQSYINTNHPDFWRTGEALDTLGRLVEERRRREGMRRAESYKNALEHFTPATSPSEDIPQQPVARPVVSVKAGVNSGEGSEGGILSYLFKAPPPSSSHRRTMPTATISAPIVSVPAVPAVTTVPSSLSVSPTITVEDAHDLETDLILSLIQSYFTIVRRNLADAVPKACMHLLVNHCLTALPTRLVSELYREERFGDLLAEDEQVAKQRQRCEEALKAYREAASLLGDVRHWEL